MKKILGKVIRIKGIEERIGEVKRWVIITEMEDEKDKEEILEIAREVKRKWEVGIDEDLTMDERKMRWRILEVARRERARGRQIVVSNRDIWVDSVRWIWNNRKER